MSTEQERILARVRKMLKLANDAGATDGERDNAMRMAHATLAKYNLDIAQAEASGGTVEEARGILEATFFGRPWARRVARATAQLFFCEYIYASATKAKDTRHYFIGRQSNAITSREMAQWLVESIAKEGRLMKNLGHEAYRSFCLGAAVSIQRRVSALIAERSKDTPEAAKPGTSLVLASLYQTEQASNQLVVESKWPKLGNGRGGKSQVNTAAYGAGRAYGDRVNLTTQLTGSTQRSIGNSPK